MELNHEGDAAYKRGGRLLENLPAPEDLVVMKRMSRPGYARRILLGAVLVLAASAILRGTWPFFAPAPMALEFAAVIITGWLGGLWPGLAATLFAVLSWLLLPPGDIGMTPAIFDSLLEFTVVSVVISWLSGARLRADWSDQERKFLLRQLQTESARLEAILQQLPLGVAIVEAPSGKLLLHNDEAERLLRHPFVPSESTTPLPLYGAVHPDGRPYRAEEYPSARAVQEGDVIKSETLRYAHDDGSVTILSVNSAPIRNETGAILAAVTVFQDITERVRAEEERTELLRQLVTSQEDERRRIARELHDQMGQHVTAILLWIKALSDEAEAVSPERARLLHQLRSMIDEIAREAHRIALELRPTALDDLGLHSALLNMVDEWTDRYRIDVDLQVSGLEHSRLGPQVETTIYRIVQEAFNNVVKHAHAGRVGLVVENARDHLLVIIEDDGVGFDTETTHSPGMGILGMKERVALVGGTLNVESSPGSGTTLLIRVPRAENKEIAQREIAACDAD